MILATSDLKDRNYEILQLISASSVLTRHVGSDIAASLKTLIGGRLKGYEKSLEDSKERVLNSLQKKAKNINADAVITIRFSTASIMKGAIEIFVYGTAVKFLD